MILATHISSRRNPLRLELRSRLASLGPGEGFGVGLFGHIRLGEDVAGAVRGVAVLLEGKPLAEGVGLAAPVANPSPKKLELGPSIAICESISATRGCDKGAPLRASSAEKGPRAELWLFHEFLRLIPACSFVCRLAPVPVAAHFCKQCIKRGRTQSSTRI